MLLVGTALAGTASAAELLWLVCLEGSGLTKYESSTCLKASAGGKWQSVGVPSGKTITVKLLALTILLKDTKTAVGESEVQCFNKGSIGMGVIKPSGKGEVVTASYEKAKENCRGVKACEKEGVESVAGVNLPWGTELVEGPGGVHLINIVPGPSGRPGWKVVCKVAGLKVEDICEEVTGKHESLEGFNEVTKNPSGVSELLVRARFAGANPALCSQSKEETGHVTGTLAILLPGGALSINNF